MCIGEGHFGDIVIIFGELGLFPDITQVYWYVWLGVISPLQV